jgi:2,4-dienoyl-CoA reductase (NADPH2)
LTQDEIRQVIGKYAEAATRVKDAGFDMVELHGGTGYLLAQFLSPRTNKRSDEYGGSLAQRQKFALDVIKDVRQAVGDFPIGYRFLADEWLPDGLTLPESCQFARQLESEGVAYISVMGGTYESFFLPEIIEKSKNNGYMTDLAAAIKKEVAIPIITAGRIATGSLAEEVLAQKKADLIGLARVIWTDPEWVNKVREGKEEEILHCVPECGDTCIQLVIKKKPAFCPRWDHNKVRYFKDAFS